jgi:hypothetical protein
MNKIAIGIVVLILFLMGALLYSARNADVAPIAQPNTEQRGGVEQGRVMDIETYVRQNISALSPEPEVLGGTFYVTKIEAANGRGEVEYEDGHNAFKADFTYTIDPDRGITITSFTTHQ